MSELLKHPGESQNNTLSPEGKAVAHTRRTFLFKLAVGLNAVVGTVLAVPLVGYLLAPAMKKEKDTGSWVTIGNVKDFPEGETRLADFISPVKALGDGQTAKLACWVRHISDQQFQVFAINCAHLGCPVHWFAQSKLFLCPCHGGTYYATGERASGPPERGLFEYKYKVVGQALVIHAGDMPTLATQASCGKKPLVNIAPTTADARSSWQA